MDLVIGHLSFVIGDRQLFSKLGKEFACAREFLQLVENRQQVFPIRMLRAFAKVEFVFITGTLQSRMTSDQ